MTRNASATGLSPEQVSNNPVVIEDYNPFWPEQFESLRSRLANVLDGLAITIEHVGSTAVPGLAAKPTIEVDVLLMSPSDLARAIELLALIGYQHRGDLGVSGREAFRTPPGDISHHLYVCTTNVEYRRHITFRDHLRSHPEDARAYASLKRELARKFGNDREAYTMAKSEFVESILRASAGEGTLSNLAVSPAADQA